VGKSVFVGVAREAARVPLAVADLRWEFSNEPSLLHDA
jgi:hypothetical protein